jgi:6-pyruvoyltetrahydropterin/6-carboxytetrahydropterin synthase
MFTLGVSDHVMIAHSFPHEFFGPAQRVHGATYALDLEVKCPQLGVHHVVMDIGALRTILREVLEPLDYQNLDGHPDFQQQYSTTERIAEYVATRARAKLTALTGAGAPPAGGSVRVLVRESPVAYAAFECAL